jgi:hypothetical protein
MAGAPGRCPGWRHPGQHLHLSVLRPRGLGYPGAVTLTGLPDSAAGLRGPMSCPGAAQGRNHPAHRPTNRTPTTLLPLRRTNNHPGRAGTGRPGWLRQCPYAAHAQGLQGYPGAVSVNSDLANGTDPLRPHNQGKERSRMEGHRDGRVPPGDGTTLWPSGRRSCGLRFGCRTVGEHGQRGRSGTFRSPRMRTRVPSRDGQTCTRRADEQAEIHRTGPRPPGDVARLRGVVAGTRL